MESRKKGDGLIKFGPSFIIFQLCGKTQALAVVASKANWDMVFIVGTGECYY